MSIEFLIPLVILVFCYGRIVWMLSRRIGSNLDNSGFQTDTFQMARTNTIKTFFLISVCFVICWLSSKTYYLMYTFGHTPDWDGIFYKVPVAMAFGNCTIDPFVYLIKYKDYQEALRECFGCKRQKDVTNDSETKQTKVTPVNTSV